VENLQVLSSLGYGGDARLDAAWNWLLSKQDASGRGQGAGEDLLENVA
jgi:hypothetical protein